MSTAMSEGLYPEPGGQEFTDGWTGSLASHARALSDVRTGKARERREAVVRLLATVGPAGMTWRELSGVTGWHHGQSSGVLSVLHKEGRIACLTEQRNRCHIYVLNDAVGDRATRQPGHTAALAREAERAASVEAQVAAARAEGWRVGRAKGHEEGRAEGYESGNAEGWQNGYDSAMEVRAVLERRAQEAYDHGRAAGSSEEAERELRYITEMRAALLRLKGRRMMVHTPTCWAESPACMLDAVEKNVKRGL